MVVVLIITEVSYLVVWLFYDLAGFFLCSYLRCYVFGCAVCFNWSIAKGAHATLESHVPYCIRRLLSSFQAQTLPFTPVF